MTTKTLIKADLMQFTGSENWYRHDLNPKILYTDGAKHVADAGGAYWLLDEIALIQPYDKAVAATEFQFWKLVVRPDHTATLTCGDGNYNVVTYAYCHRCQILIEIGVRVTRRDLCARRTSRDAW